MAIAKFDRILEKSATERVELIHSANDSTVRQLMNVIKSSRREMLADLTVMLSSDKVFFKSANEARAWLSQRADITSIQALIQRADTLDEPYRTQWLNKLKSPAYRVKISRQSAIDQAVKLNTIRSGQDADKVMRNALVGVALVSYTHSIYSMQKATRLGFSFEQPNARMLNAILGRSYSSRTSMLLAGGYGDAFKNTLMKGLLEGKSIEDISKTTQMMLPSAELWQAKRLVRSQITSTGAEGANQSYKDMNVEKYRVVATLDERTCDICGNMDGQVFFVSDAMEGENMPMFHLNCRCSTAPYVDSTVLSDLKRSARDPTTGKSIKVSADVTYSQWAKDNAGVSKIYDKYVSKGTAKA